MRFNRSPSQDISAPDGALHAARRRFDDVKAAHDEAQRALEAAEGDRATLALDDAAIALHVSREQIARTRADVAKRLLDKTQADLAKAEAAAELARRRAQHAQAQAARDKAASRVRDFYATFVKTLETLKAEVAAADELVAKANAQSIEGDAYLVDAESAAVDRPRVEETIIAESIERLWVFERTGERAPSDAVVRVSADGATGEIDAGPAVVRLGDPNRVVKRAFRVQRYRPAVPLTIGPRLAGLDIQPLAPVESERPELVRYAPAASSDAA